MEENLKQKTKKGLYWKFAEQFSNYGIQFIIGIFMARMLSPEDYGITALPAVFMALAGIFASSGFSSAMVRKKELTEEDLSTAFIYSTCVGIICYIILFLASPWIADFYDVPVLKSLMRVTSLSFIFNPLITPQNIILQRRLDFQTPTKIGVVAKIGIGIIGITLAMTGYGVWALVLSNLSGGIIILILFWLKVKWLPKKGWSNESFKYLWGYGNKLMGSQLLDTLYNNISPIFIGKYYSPTDLGIYNRAQNYAQMPSQNLYGVISSVTFPVLSKIQDDDERLRSNYRRMLKVIGFIVFPIMMWLASMAKPLIIIMITEKWIGCVLLLQILCFSKMWWPIHALNLNLLLVKGRSDYFLRLEIVKKIWGISIMAITLPMGIVYFCASSIISGIFSLIVNTYYTGKLLDLGFLKQMRDFAPTLTISLLVFIIGIASNHIFENMYLSLFIGTVIGVVCYLGLAIILKFDEIQDVKYLLSKK